MSSTRSVIVGFVSILFVALVILTLFFTRQAYALPAELYGISGWAMTQSEFAGYDAVTCGASSTVGQIQLVGETDTTPVVDVPLWQVEVYDKNDNRLFTWTATSSTNVSPKFCYQMSSDYIVTNTAANSTYYHHDGVRIGLKPEDPSDFYGQSYLGMLHLRRRASGVHNIAPVTPHNTYHTSNPTYFADTRSIVNLYNSTAKLRTKYIAVNTGNGNDYDNMVASSGGAGVQELPSLALPDGHYVWGFFTTLNGDYLVPGAPGSLRLNNGIPTSGITTATAFILDTTPPTTSVSLTLNGTSSGQVNVTIYNDTQDVTSGSYLTRLFLNETSPGNATSSITAFVLPLGSVDPHTISVGATLTPGATYEYYALTRDIAGNFATSTVMTYTAPSEPLTPPVAVIVEPTGAPYTIEHGAGNEIDFEAQAEDSSGNTINPATVNWEWRMSSCLLGDIYSTDQLFSTSTVNNRIRPDGSTYTMYLRTYDAATSLWSTNCPSVDVTVDCPIGTSWNSLTCELIASPTPDLISQNFTISSGPYPQGSTIDLSAEVRNAGTDSTGGAFNDNFSYSWDNVSWTNIAPFIPHGSLAVSSGETDTEQYTPNQSGNLYLQHCVDSFNEIDEDTNEIPNCSQIGPITVTSAPSGNITGTNCSIAQGASTCNGTLDWDIQNASLPNIYNMRKSLDHSSNDDFEVGSVIELLEGQNIILARDGNTELDRTTLTASCNNATDFWDGSLCGQIPDVSISSSPTTIRVGQTAVVGITINTEYDMNCRVYGAHTTPDDFTHTGNVASVPYNYPTRELSSDQIVQIRCETGSGYIVTDEARVKVIGNLEER